MKRLLLFLVLCIWICWGETIRLNAQQRFPPPDFESGYQLPVTRTPPARALPWAWLDMVLLVGCLGLATHFALRRRSRPSLLALSLFSLGYFGFYRKGCVCAIGSVQNVALSLFNSKEAVPLSVLVFFLAPLLVALFAGRTFCAAVCPHGALQDLVLLKPKKVPVWLEQGLGVFPFLYLGAGIVFAATGSAFVICRYDPFVPLFRVTGSVGMLLLGGAFLLIGIFVGRPYCRFVCPYGALLKLAAKVSKWRVTITPDVCTQCRLCEASCPYGAIEEPTQTPLDVEALTRERRRLGRLLLALPLLILAGAWLGSTLAVPASRLDKNVALAERYLRAQKNPVPLGVQSAAALALTRAEQDPKGLLAGAMETRKRFERAGWWFGAWTGLVVGLQLIGLSVRRRREAFEPHRGACLACARCFTSCPSERMRCGWPVLPPEASVAGGVQPSMARARVADPVRS